MVPAHDSPDPRAMDVAELRLKRRVLRHEATQVTHWRRLVRARLDLTVARAVLPERLGGDATQYLGTDAPGPDVAHYHLVSIVQGAGDQLPVADLTRLRAADDALAAYEVRVRCALMVATDLLVERLSADPTIAAMHLSSLTS